MPCPIQATCPRFLPPLLVPGDDGTPPQLEMPLRPQERTRLPRAGPGPREVVSRLHDLGDVQPLPEGEVHLALPRLHPWATAKASTTAVAAPGEGRPWERSLPEHGPVNRLEARWGGKESQHQHKSPRGRVPGANDRPCISSRIRHPVGMAGGAPPRGGRAPPRSAHSLPWCFTKATA